MIRSAFLRRMAAAALACAFLDVKLPEVESDAPYFGSARACVDCGKPDPEVAAGFLQCRPCFNAEPVATVWLHMDYPAGILDVQRTGPLRGIAP